MPFDMALRSTRHLGEFFASTVRNPRAWGQFVNVDKQLTDTSPLKELIRSNVDINALRYGGKGICVALTRLRPAEAMKSIATGESC